MTQAVPPTLAYPTRRPLWDTNRHQEKMVRTYRLIVSTEKRAAFTPPPDDEYEFVVKQENAKLLLGLTEAPTN